MEQSSMKLFVAVIFALALLYVFFTVIAPNYLWQPNPEPVINEELGESETNLGHYNSAKGNFSKGYTVQAQGFESAARSIVFECNNPIYCCEESEECDKTIEWSNSGDRYFNVQEDKEIDVSTRCRFEEIYICKVFLGAEPAQVDITEQPEIPVEVNIAESKILPLNFSVENSGKKTMLDTIASAKLYKIKKMPFGQEPEKVLVKIFETEKFALEPKEEIDPELEVEIPGNGDYLIEFTVFESNDETNFESKEFEFTAIGDNPIQVCVPGKMQIQELEKCVYSLPCNCPSIEGCKKQWRLVLGISTEEEFELISSDDSSVTLQYEAEYKIPEWCDPETMTCEEFCEEKEIPEPVCRAGNCFEDETNCRVWLTCHCEPGANTSKCKEIWTEKSGERNFQEGNYMGKPALYLPGSIKRITQIYCDECGRYIPKEINCCELPKAENCGGNTCEGSPVPQPEPEPQVCTDGVPSIGNCIQDNAKCELIFPCVCMTTEQCEQSWKQKLSAMGYTNLEIINFLPYDSGSMSGVYVEGDDRRECIECEPDSRICWQGIMGLESTCMTTG